MSAKSLVSHSPEPSQCAPRGIRLWQCRSGGPAVARWQAARGTSMRQMPQLPPASHEEHAGARDSARSAPDELVDLFWSTNSERVPNPSDTDRISDVLAGRPAVVALWKFLWL